MRMKMLILWRRAAGLLVGRSRRMAFETGHDVRNVCSEQGSSMFNVRDTYPILNLATVAPGTAPKMVSFPALRPLFIATFRQKSKNCSRV